MSSFEDPEKHFLGNLLDDDSIGPINERSEEDPSSSSSISSQNSVTPVITPISTFWPEPPPPYSPPQSDLLNTSQWFQSTDSINNGLSDAFSFNFTSQVTNPLVTSLGPQQQQVHHFHHNLHHHTHTHNFQVQNHYFSSSPPQKPQRSPGVIGSERHNGCTISNDSSNSIPEWNYLNSSEIIVTPFSYWKKISNGSQSHDIEKPQPKKENCKTYAAVSQKKCESKKSQKSLNCKSPTTPPSRIIVNGQPNSAPVVNKMPFSYRDVAARVEKKESPNTVEMEKQVKVAESKKNHVQLEQRQKLKNVKQEKNNNSENGFKKISKKTNKGNKEKTSASVPSCVETVLPVHAPTRYDVLNNLENTLNSNTQEAVGNDSPNTEKSTASFEYNTEESDIEEYRPQLITSSNGNNNNTKSSKKKLQTQSSQKRRTRRKVDNNWTDESARIIFENLKIVICHILTFIQWTFQLIIDVCLKIYDVSLSFLEYLGDGFLMMVKNLVLFIVMAILYVFIKSVWLFFQSLTTPRLLEQLFYDYRHRPEVVEWGYKKNIQLPSNASDYIDHLMKEEVRDAYTVLGLSSDCSDTDIRKNYKKLCTLVSPDKCTLDGSHYAVNLLNRAFDAIGSSESRKEYTMENACDNDNHRMVLNAWDTFRDHIELLRCTLLCECGDRHMKIFTTIKPNEARYCRHCDLKHAAKQNDIWMESWFFGLKKVYFTCYDNVVYDITEWVTCTSQKNIVKTIRANTHSVQYRFCLPSLADNLNTNCCSNQSINSTIDTTNMTNDFQDDSVLRQRNLAKIPFKCCEPADDRNRRAANRRQKRWR